MLKHLKRVLVAFQPSDPRSASARELLQRLSGDKARKSNPACKLEFQVDDDLPHGQAFVELLFADNEQRKVMTADKRIQDIERIIERKGEEMELKGVFKEVGYNPWQPANRLSNVGATQTSSKH